MDNNTRRILLICKLKGLGFDDNDLFSKVMIGRGNTLKQILNKYIKGKNLNIKTHIETLFSMKQFRIENYMCQKCQTWHYLGSKVFNSHSKHSNNIHHYSFQKQCIEMTLDSILSKQYRNNKDNKEFQDLIESINQLCKLDVLKSINSKLRKHILAKYKTFKEITYNSKINYFNIRLQRNIRKIKELIDLVDYHNFLTQEMTADNRSYQMNDRNYIFKSKYETLKLLRKYGNIENVLIKFRRDLMKHVNSDKFLSQIFDILDVKNGRINNTKLYNKINQIWEDHKNSMLDLNFGINYSDKKESNNKWIAQNNTFYDRDSNADDLRKMDDSNYNIFFTYENSQKFKSYKFWINYVLKNPQISFLDKGIDAIKRKHRKPSNFIIYKYDMSSYQLKELRSLSDKVFEKLDKEKPFKDYSLTQLIKYCNDKHIYLKPFSHKLDIIKSVELFNKDITEIYQHDLNVMFTYINQSNKLRNYQKFIKSIGITEKISFTKLFLSNLEKGNNLFTYIQNKHNVKMTNIDRHNFDKDLGTCLYYINFENKLRKTVYLHNEKYELDTHDLVLKERKHLHKVLVYSLRHDLVKKHFIRFLNNKVEEINHKVRIRLIKHDLTIKLITEMKLKYESMNKRTNKAKLYNKEIQTLETRTLESIIPLLSQSKLQKKPFERFINRLQKTDKFNVSIMNKTVYNLLKHGISKYNDKLHTRIINTTRSKVECIKYALRLMKNDTMIEIIDSKLDQSNENCPNDQITYKNKFDEILDNYEKDAIMFSNLSAEICIPIKSLMIAIVKILPHIDNKVFENYMIYKMYKMLQNYQSFENKVLD